MNALAVHFFIETKSSFRKKQQMFLNYLFPLGFYLMMGAVMTQLNPLFLNDMIPAMILFSVMSSTFLAIPETFVSGRTTGVFRGYRINGVPSLPLVILPVLSCVIHMLIVSAVILFTAPLLFHAPAPTNTPLLFLITLLSVISFSGPSVLIGIISSNNRVSTMLSQMLFIPSMLIGGLMIPFEVLPENVKTAALFLPSNHSMTLFNRFAFEREPSVSPNLSLAALLVIGAASFILSGLFFKWNNKKK